jgi:peptide/nickel transport system substrate-binding protein
MRVRAVMLALATLLIAAPARAENVVRWATILQPSGLDPHAFNDQQTLAIHLELFEPMVDVDWRMGIEPSLALRWSLVSPTVWRVRPAPGGHLPQRRSADGRGYRLQLGSGEHGHVGVEERSPRDRQH